MQKKTIREARKLITYDTKEFCVNRLIDLVQNSRLILSDREETQAWTQKEKSKFIESLLLRIQIPILCFSQTENNTLEIIDGYQRVKTLVEFCNDQFSLVELSIVSDVNGCLFNDLPDRIKEQLLSNTMRAIVLDLKTREEIKKELYERFNKN
ncbi:DUF262 domain-containing protein [Ileibacterium valens]|uniref:DUF262 domain-containing protein n=1 Tax=Ileibacterium valens TaxID=1862668 RepID=UPI002570DCC8|nr:DUF262 domain-containing protein [Ileibacterium valens]